MYCKLLVAHGSENFHAAIRKIFPEDDLLHKYNQFQILRIWGIASSPKINICLISEAILSINNFEVLKRIRQRNACIGIFCVMENSENVSRIPEILNMGADDVIVLPADNQVTGNGYPLIYNSIEAYKKKWCNVFQGGPQHFKLQDKDFYYQEKKLVDSSGDVTTLTMMQADILKILCNSLNDYVSISYIIYIVWGIAPGSKALATTKRSLDVSVSRVKKQLNKSAIIERQKYLIRLVA